ncbi:hypothetical protein SAMN05421863_100566 [Nitrosomonas communis]|uniref:Uncharacterized protein n=1 Tax=Nitrosomonas communis TaxID=44574 RepID=A0A1I4KYK3_9PROT|nr:hypothetical protein SAMN05421882_100443 [Nitrosomonas communis]SFL83741.1 hypothetical protein SAMN05421863_100566 [Nitrosomonas communis]
MVIFLQSGTMQNLTCCEEKRLDRKAGGNGMYFDPPWWKA